MHRRALFLTLLAPFAVTPTTAGVAQAPDSAPRVLVTTALTIGHWAHIGPLVGGVVQIETRRRPTTTLLAEVGLAALGVGCADLVAAPCPQTSWQALVGARWSPVTWPHPVRPFLTLATGLVHFGTTDFGNRAELGVDLSVGRRLGLRLNGGLTFVFREMDRELLTAGAGVVVAL
jgi:hypothetical protein